MGKVPNRRQQQQVTRSVAAASAGDFCEMFFFEGGEVVVGLFLFLAPDDFGMAVVEQAGQFGFFGELEGELHIKREQIYFWFVVYVEIYNFTELRH